MKAEGNIYIRILAGTRCFLAFFSSVRDEAYGRRIINLEY